MKGYSVIRVAVLLSITSFLGIMLLYWSISIHNTLGSRAALEQRAAFLNGFGRSGTVVEIYSELRGTKPANYSTEWYAVLKNQEGEKLKVKFKEEKPVRGEIWSVEHDGEPRLKKAESETIRGEEIILPEDPTQVFVLRNAWWLGSIHRILAVFVFPAILFLLVSPFVGAFFLMFTCGLLVEVFEYLFGVIDEVDSLVTDVLRYVGPGVLAIGIGTFCGSVFLVLDAYLPAPHHAWYWLVWVAVVVLVGVFRARAMVTSRRA